MAKPRDHLAVMSSRAATLPGDPDFFPTAPAGGRAVGELVRDVLDPAAEICWEPACGSMSLAHGLADYFPRVLASDAYAYDGNRIFDFLGEAPPWCSADWIITNPPFGDNPERFIRRAYAQARRGVAILGRVGLLESLGRHSLLYRDCPLTLMAPFSERLALVKGRWDPDASSAAFYAWFIWIKPPRRAAAFMARVGGQLLPAILPIPPGTLARLTRPDDAALFGVSDRARGLA